MKLLATLPSVRGCLIAMVLAASSATSSSALTVGFEGVSLLAPAGGSYVENGVTVTAIGGDLNIANGSVHIDDAYSNAHAVSLTAGQPFGAESVTLTSLGYSFARQPERLRENIRIAGYADGRVVAEAIFALSDVFQTVQHLVLGDRFTGLERLVIDLRYVYGWEICDDAPCGHFELEEVELSGIAPIPAPLPPGAALMGSAVLGLGLLGWRRRRRG